MVKMYRMTICSDHMHLQMPTSCVCSRVEPLYVSRKSIVTGTAEAPAPAEGEEVPAPADGDDEEPPPGVPEFWLNVLRNCEDTAEQVRVLDSSKMLELSREP